MAKRKAPAKPHRKKGQPGTRVRVKGHTRSPRGPNAGKRAVYVPGYTRRAPKKR